MPAMHSADDLLVFEPFKRVSAAARTRLTRGVVRKTFEAAGAVLHKGQPASGAYLVLSGRLRVFTLTPNGHEATIYHLDAGETCVLALNCLFNDLLYPAWVQAEVPTRVAIVPGALYRELFAGEAAIQELTVQARSTLVFRLMAELEAVHSMKHRQRLVQHLLAHASSEGVVVTTQQQLAGHLGTTREVVARLIQDLTLRGYVRTQRGRVTIRDLFGLRSELQV
jgi:CRP/FNR family transcriptional regulator, anaerobic regulatory protein